MPFSIRLAEDADLPAMAELRAAERGDAAFWMDRIGGYRRGDHSPQKALAERVIFVAVDKTRLTGFAAGHRTRRFDCDGELQWINVAAESRGQGVGMQLIERLGIWFVEQDAHRVCVNVDTQNTAARALYARCGAREWLESWMLWDEAARMHAH